MSDLEVELFDIPSAAKLLSISPFTLRRHISVGNIIPTRVGRRVLLSRETVGVVKVRGLPSLRSDNRSKH